MPLNVQALANRSRFVWRVVVLFAVGCLVTTGSIARPFLSLDQWAHTTFTTKDGAPLGVRAIAQDRDGFLWFGSEEGLTRFDGVRFVRMFADQLPATPITALYAASDGSLWTGDRYGSVTHIAQDGAVTTYAPPTLLRATVMYLSQTRDGTLWVITVSGAQSFRDGTWRRYTPEADGTPKEPLFQVFGDRHQRIWLLTEQEAYRHDPGAARFVPDTLEAAKDAMLDRPGTSWRPTDLTSDEQVDAEGALWIPTFRGLVRLHWPVDTPAAEAPIEEWVKREDGLTGQEAENAFVDRDGAIWVTTSGGIDRFRVGKLVPLALHPAAYTPSILADATGGLWIDSLSDMPVVRYEEAAEPHREASRRDLGSRVQRLAVATDGAVWGLGPEGLARVYRGAATAVPLPPDFALLKSMRVGSNTMAVTDGGVLWLGYMGSWRLDHGAWLSQKQIPGLPGHEAPPTAMAAKGDTVWIGYTSNRLARVNEPGMTVSVLGQADGLAVGNVLSLHPTSADSVWVGGELGVQRLNHGRFATLTGAGGERFSNVSGIWQRADGELWLNAVRGLYRVSADEMRAWSTSPTTRVRFERFDDQDGRQGITKAYSGPTLASTDGHTLYVASARGVSRIDTLRVARNDVPPTPVIDAINEVPVSAQALLLPGTTRRVDIDFTAAVLDRPGEARFMLRLLDSGSDAWQETSDRRISYANLAPGSYRFEVKAANGDGVWSTTVASAGFSIAPAFYQTWWFRLLGGVVAAALLWLLYRIRVRSLRILMSARSIERESIARDLHDTLLQNLHALLLRVHLASKAVSDPDARSKLQKAMEVTQLAVEEGRDKVSRLRDERAPVHDFPERIQRLAAALGDGQSSRLVLDIRGIAHALCAPAEEDIYAIASELLSNAFRHSNALTVTVTLDFHARYFELSVRDDGVGMPADSGEPQDQRSGWGLVGMRERAGRLAADLRTSSGPGKGTFVRLRVPAHLAYWKPPGILARIRSWLRR
jgi:signal transduction histidine kinase/ligand-binding sensor domain-containing protein